MNKHIGVSGILVLILISYTAAAAMIQQHLQNLPPLDGGQSGGDILRCEFDNGAFEIEYNSSTKNINYYDGLHVKDPKDKLIASRGKFVPVFKSNKPMAKFEPQPDHKFELYNDNDQPIIELILNYKTSDQFPYRIYPFSAVFMSTGQTGHCETTSFPSIDPMVLFFNLR